MLFGLSSLASANIGYIAKYSLAEQNITVTLDNSQNGDHVICSTETFIRFSSTNSNESEIRNFLTKEITILRGQIESVEFSVATEQELNQYSQIEIVSSNYSCAITEFSQISPVSDSAGVQNYPRQNFVATNANDIYMIAVDQDNKAERILRRIVDGDTIFSISLPTKSKIYDTWIFGNDLGGVYVVSSHSKIGVCTIDSVTHEGLLARLVEIESCYGIQAADLAESGLISLLYNPVYNTVQDSKVFSFTVYNPKSQSVEHQTEFDLLRMIISGGNEIHSSSINGFINFTEIMNINNKNHFGLFVHDLRFDGQSHIFETNLTIPNLPVQQNPVLNFRVQLSADLEEIDLLFQSENNFWTELFDRPSVAERLKVERFCYAGTRRFFDEFTLIMAMCGGTKNGDRYYEMELAKFDLLGNQLWRNTYTEDHFWEADPGKEGLFWRPYLATSRSNTSWSIFMDIFGNHGVRRPSGWDGMFANDALYFSHYRSRSAAGRLFKIDLAGNGDVSQKEFAVEKLSQVGNVGHSRIRAGHRLLGVEENGSAFIWIGWYDQNKTRPLPRDEIVYLDYRDMN
jgi:hypothetical protein